MHGVEYPHDGICLGLCKILGSLLPAMAIGTAANAGWAMIKTRIVLSFNNLSRTQLNTPTAHAQ